jgi:hypothetical protein
MAKKFKSLMLLSVNPLSSVETGNILHQVAFGKYIKVTKEVAKRIQQPTQNTTIPKEIGINELVLIMKFDSLESYNVGSKWKLEIDDSSKSIKLNKEK